MVIAIITLISEIIILIYILIRIKKSKQVTLQDTAIYPFLLVVLSVMIFYVKIKVGDEDIFPSIAYSFNKSLELLTASIDSNIVSMMEGNKLLLFDYYFGCVISFLAIFSISLSLLKITIKNFFKFKFFNKELNYLFNLTDEAKTYIKGLDKDKRKNTIIILQRNNNKYSTEKIYLSDNKIKYIIMDFNSEKSFNKTISRLLKFHENHKVYFVFFSKTDEEIYNYALMSKAYVKTNNLIEKNVEFILNANNSQAMFIDELLEEKDSKTYSPVRTFNKHELISFDFILKNNLAKYFPRNLLNDNLTVKDSDINLFVFGFGKVNQAILKDVLINTQFIGENLEHKNLNIEIFDVKDNVLMFELANGLFKYRKSDFNQGEYLDLPDDFYSFVNLHFNYNIESINFMHDIKNLLEKKDKPQVNYFFVSLCSDFENSMVAKKILDNIKGENYYNTIFVRTKNSLSLGNPNLISYGDESKAFTYENLIKDQTYFDAKRESLIYAKKDLNKVNILDEWSKISKIKQQNNLSAVMSVSFKLSLLGFDKLPSKEEYYKAYDPNNERANYSYKEYRSSRRDVIAYSEHSRWNSLEINCGVLPLSKSEAYNGGSLITRTKDEQKHLCIASQKGLYDYYNFISEINEKEHQDNNPDVVKYDYDLMDNLYD